ncbi:LytTR family DNA-binding domain-containing protein [Ruminococcus sp.]|uniref:LytR/AlgR family response regulator transcription factor n=1 Tax=Ruminococcus sp. TaxID=41978 RepID=UPI001B1697D6|nr:LytTR family DNA-binding domain-containing protein [Ruminococcus sp.]MBO5558596.1 response regulator transcription factor [Ruminococcus sp.]
MIRVAICDDDNNQINALKFMLTEWNEHIIITEYTSAEQFLFGYPDTPCDLLLLDIEMGDMNGMELARRLRDKGDMLPIVFITGYSEFMQDGYDVEALHYLLKPVDKDKLFAVLDRYASRHPADSRVIFHGGDETVCVNADDIMYLEAFGKKTQIMLKDGKEILCTCGLSAAAERLGEGFVSCHRSYVVNLGFVRSISKTEITLDNGRKIPLSRRLYDSVNKAFISFYKENRP